MKTKVFNVIILDKSGSMSSIARQAIDGVNETIGAIRSAQEKDPDQEHTVTLVAFCGCEMRKLYDNVPVAQVKQLTDADYRPCCMTPLYDAIGSTITRVHQLKAAEENAMASVTIITDGYENASREFTGTAIKALIQSYKDDGWLFTYIGADHDVERVAYSLAIDNQMQFDKSASGTTAMFAKERASRASWMHRMKAVMSDEKMSKMEKMRRMKDVNKDYFEDY